MSEEIRDPDIPAEDPLSEDDSITTVVTVDRPATVEKLEQPRLAPTETIDPADIPKPFRPSSLTALIEKYRKKWKLRADDPSLKPFHFRRAHGLPVPRCLIAVQGYSGANRWPIKTVEAVDNADAINQYYHLVGIKTDDVAKIKFQCVVREK